MAAIRGMFGGIEDAKADQGNIPLLRPGSYLLSVDQLRSFKSKKPPFNAFFLAEFDVLGASGDDASPEGTKAAWLVNMIHSPALGVIKAFTLAAVPGITEEEITEDAMEEMLSESQPLHGLQVRANAEVVKTKADRDFTKVTFQKAEG